MPGRHPDDDVLADLAADVLPAVDARAVEAHVMGCDRCAALLEDAERVRGLLLADDPGPVPPQVWQRIEAALTAEAAASRSVPADLGPRDRSTRDRIRPGLAVTRPSAPADAVADTAAFQAFVAGPDGAVRPPDAPVPPAPAEPAAGTAGWSEDADPLDDPARWTAPRPLRGGSSRSRRDSRSDGDRRRAPVLLAAAAAVVLMAVVAGVVRLTARSDSSTASFTQGGAAGGSPAASAAAEGRGVEGAVVLRSERRYSESTLAKQAGALLVSAAASAENGQSTKPRGLESRAPLSATAEDLSNPANLSACLTGLDVSQDRLLAVDLATFDGREAAVLLLRVAEGGHEVWVVERTCSRGSEGALAYTRLSG